MARNQLARSSEVPSPPTSSLAVHNPSDGIVVSFDVIVTRHKNGYKGAIDTARIKHFMKLVRPNVKMTYRDFIGKEFAQQDFYVMVDWMISIGLCNKQGSSYVFPGNFAAGFTSYWNKQVGGFLA